MNQEQIIQMAREANLDEWYIKQLIVYLERFAKLVAEHERNRTWTQAHWTEYELAIVAQEREACADMVFRYIGQTVNMEARGCLASVAYDIRARDNKHD